MNRGILKTVTIIIGSMLTATPLSANKPDPKFEEFRAAVITQQVNQQCPILNEMQDAALQLVINATSNNPNIHKAEEQIRKSVLGVPCHEPKLKPFLAKGRQAAEISLLNAVLVYRYLKGIEPVPHSGNETDKMVDAYLSNAKKIITKSSGEAAWTSLNQKASQIATELSHKGVSNKEKGVDAFFKATSRTKAKDRLLHTFTAFFLYNQNLAKNRPLVRDANDETGWRAWRGTSAAPNWAVSSGECGKVGAVCNLFLTPKGRVGISLGHGPRVSRPKDVELIIRDTEKSSAPTKNTLKFEKGKPKLDSAAVFVNEPKSDNRVVLKGIAVTDEKSKDTKLGNQTGYFNFREPKFVFMLPEKTWGLWKKLTPNDVLLVKVSFHHNKFAIDDVTTSVPNQGFNRAVNWTIAKPPG